MKNARTAAYLLLTATLACIGVRTARADGLEGVHESAGAIFDNNGLNRATPDSDAPVIAPGGGPGSPLAPTAPPQAAPKSSGIPMPAFVSDAAGTFKDNWKALLAGAAVGGFVGAAMGSTIPGAGTILGGLIGATLGMGLALLFKGSDDKAADMGKTLTGAGAGALIGAAFGSAVPVIGTILGGIAGAVIGGLLTHFFF